MYREEAHELVHLAGVSAATEGLLVLQALAACMLEADSKDPVGLLIRRSSSQVQAFLKGLDYSVRQLEAAPRA